MAGPYKLMGLHLQGPDGALWDTIVPHRNLGVQMSIPGNDDARLNNWADDKFEDVKQYVTDRSTHGPGAVHSALHIYKAIFHRNQIKHGNSTIVLDPGRGVTELSALHPIPATVVVVPYENDYDQILAFMLAHATMKEMKKANPDQWWAVAVYVLADGQEIDSFPFANAQ
ncbi:hypothetical protein PG993_006958 [Apiospora rasikravindrae]|uniref:Uncharacterized protein n=1 Tax=Apiospora rasikravindrae TaxID=990691 RepID=A0ABR1SW51_9PEZI